MNWISWKWELLATSRDRGLYGTIIGTDILPSTSRSTATIVGGVKHIGTTPITQLDDQWHYCNNTTYNQTLLCITPPLQTAINETNQASKAWDNLTRKFKSCNPSKLALFTLTIILITWLKVNQLLLIWLPWKNTGANSKEWVKSLPYHHTLPPYFITFLNPDAPSYRNQFSHIPSPQDTIKKP